MISNTYATKILNVICGVKDELNLPSKLYLGLSSSEPSATGTVSGEPSAPSYGRTIVGGTTEDSMFGNAYNGVISNNKEIHFMTARTSWGTMKYFFLSDSLTGAAILWGDLMNKDGTNGVTIGEETVPVFYEGDLKASLDVAL